ncbi:MAG: cytochrome B6-F complex subunit VI (PetL) [Chroococcidiopsidaceae cyanobacterium CP_BM_RX_35]|nr:cytochrome B6-F complex subunit VI (PetL) [Chroococcidiopsidaceae cyanobacterium CP_BM_RX_35]
MFGVIAYISILLGAFAVAVLLLFGLRAVKLL